VAVIRRASIIKLVPAFPHVPGFLIIQRYQHSAPIIAKCGNNREQGTGSRCFGENIALADEANCHEGSTLRRQRKKLSQVDRSTEIQDSMVGDEPATKRQSCVTPRFSTRVN
jgi:hypothetical protein